MTRGSYAILAEGLEKSYGKTRTLDGLDLAVEKGTVLGLLGPNGAGKTTAVRVLTTLIKPDAGRAEVAGFNVARQADELRSRIGLAGQYATVDEHLTGRENLTMFGRLYHLPGKHARRRTDELLERFDLVAAASRMAKTYSGGMRRRLDLAASLIVSPPVLFLDEPTTGLDPRGRLAVWETVAELVAGGTTLLLTTQYLEESDRIAVVDGGKVIAEGTPDKLKSRVGGEHLQVTAVEESSPRSAARILERLGTGWVRIDNDLLRVAAPVAGGVRLLAVLRDLDAAGIEVVDFGVRSYPRRRVLDPDRTRGSRSRLRGAVRPRSSKRVP